MATDTTTICFRMDAEDRRRLEAVAHAETGGAINLSGFIRDHVLQFVDSYFQEENEADVLDDYTRFQLRELDRAQEEKRAELIGHQVSTS